MAPAGPVATQTARIPRTRPTAGPTPETAGPTPEWEGNSMFPTEFTYAAPATLAEAVQLMQGAEAKPLAGGQSLLPLMKLRLASPGQLVDLRKIGELRGIREDGDAIIIGA